jgi:hypothetical protein
MRVKTVVASVFLCVAIGIASSPAKAAPPTDACALLTQAQVSSVLGVSIGAGQRLAPSQPALCGWGQMGGKRVVLSIYTQMGSMSPVERYNLAKNSPVKGIVKTPVSGIGDDAVYMTTPGFGTGLFFRKGSAAFDLRVYGFPLDQLKQKEKTLALDIIGKL